MTGHESLGHFARRYGFTVVGAVIPSLTTEAESSAGSLETLKRLIADHHVTVVFIESGTPARTVDALATETGVVVIPLATHTLPPDGSYFTFERNLADTIVRDLK